MEHINKIHIRGVLGFARIHDIGDTQMVRFSVATDHAFKDRNGGAVIETTWYQVIAFKTDNMPDFSSLVKGARVDVNGRLRFVYYTNASGNDIKTPEILADEVTLCN